jgi:hypothetical protein
VARCLDSAGPGRAGPSYIMVITCQPEWSYMKWRTH